jgi:hypothetical protein
VAVVDGAWRMFRFGALVLTSLPMGKPLVVVSVAVVVGALVTTRYWLATHPVPAEVAMRYQV